MAAAQAAVIRRAVAGDAHDAATLWLETGEHLTELNPRAFKLPATDGLPEFLEEQLEKEASSMDSATFVAELGGRVVGIVSVRLVPPMESARWQVLRDVAQTRAEIDALAVLRDFRRRGIARQLMTEAESWGRNKGATVFLLDTYVASPLSVPFYERLGYARRSTRFVKPHEYGAPIS